MGSYYGDRDEASRRIAVKYIRVQETIKRRWAPFTLRLGFFLKLMVDKLQREDGYYM
jgi:hypothetical protein